MFVSYNACSPILGYEDETIADSGVSSHMSGKKVNFVDYRKDSSNRRAKIANGKTIPIENM
jgi:hypothetical protein